jgi:ketol-acid reductoisomerase
MRIFRDDQANLKYIRDQSILILGYGGQGRAFGLNLRDSGLSVTVCLKSDSASKKIAVEDNLKTITPSQIDSQYSLIIFLIPDHIHGDFFERHIAKRMRKEATLVFAHGYSIHFGIVKPPPGADIIMVAPHGPGVDLRQKFLDKSGLSCFIAEYQNGSGQAIQKALALAKAIGATRAGAFLTTFEHEAIGDIFGEQVLLCGGLSELAMKAYMVMVDNGIPRENAYLETVHQIDLLASLIRRHGIHGMTRRISKTAQYGMYQTRGKIIDKVAEKRFGNIFRQIKSGKFAEKWQAEYKNGLKNLNEYIETLKEDRLEKTSKRMRKLLKGRPRK